MVHDSDLQISDWALPWHAKHSYLFYRVPSGNARFNHLDLISHITYATMGLNPRPSPMAKKQMPMKNALIPMNFTKRYTSIWEEDIHLLSVSCNSWSLMMYTSSKGGKNQVCSTQAIFKHTWRVLFVVSVVPAKVAIFPIKVLSPVSTKGYLKSLLKSCFQQADMTALTCSHNNPSPLPVHAERAHEHDAL